jgi:hypothetical protein
LENTVTAAAADVGWMRSTDRELESITFILIKFLRSPGLLRIQDAAPMTSKPFFGDSTADAVVAKVDDLVNYMRKGYVPDYPISPGIGFHSFLLLTPRF